MISEERSIATTANTVDATVGHQQRDESRKAKSERIAKLREMIDYDYEGSMQRAKAILEEEQQGGDDEAEEGIVTLEQVNVSNIKGAGAETLLVSANENEAPADAPAAAHHPDRVILELIAKVERLTTALHQTEAKLDRACLEIKTMMQGFHAVTAPSYL